MGPVGFGSVNDVDIKASVKREINWMNEIPTKCARCGSELDYKPDSPNQLEPGKPIRRWVCGPCMRKNIHKTD